MSETRDYELGPYFCENPHHALLHRVLDYELRVFNSRNEYGLALEFGVGDGASLHCISRKMRTVGFDSFEGLPEDWRPGFNRGMFACDPPPAYPNERLVIGLFEDTLPRLRMVADTNEPLALVHIDCDLYSSTRTVLQFVGPLLRKGTVIVFDEWHGYPEAEKHEQRAWGEYVDELDIDWDVIGHGVQQWAVRIR